MKLKLVEMNGKTYAEVVDGKPIVLEDDGQGAVKEVPFDLGHTRTTIARLNGESKAFREKAEAYESRFKAFEGIEDPESARKALDTVKNIKDGDLIQAGKVEEFKAAAKKAAEDQVANASKSYLEKIKLTEKERDKFRDELSSEKIGGAFSRSKFIAEKAAIPIDLMQARFGGAFKVEDGAVVAYDSHGNKIPSRARLGEAADFDEAIEALVDQYPYRDQILKGTGSTGSGAAGSRRGSGAKTVSRADFSKMNPMEQSKIALNREMQIVD